jgi:AbiJ N-terminal domain 4
MDEPLRNGLWDIVSIKLHHLDREKQGYGYSFYDTQLFAFGRSLYHSFFKEPVDQVPADADRLCRRLRKWLLTDAAWWEVYDFLEFMARNIEDPKSFVDACNRVMEREVSGYRFVESVITPIIDEAEVKEIERALEASARPVAQHLAASLELLADRRSPNYRKSVDEAILSVEAAAREVSGLPKATLGQALKAIKIDLHPAFKSAFEKLYGYTSDESGIRHSLMEDSREIDQADARYMLIACSAFVNYLRAKSAKELR